MIEIIPTLLTPAMLALSPPSTPAPSITYDWQSQTSSAVDASGKVIDVSNATWNGTRSQLSGSFVIDDMNSD